MAKAARGFDAAPESQFLFPEFQLAERLLLARGSDTLILDPAEFEYANGKLRAGGKRIDIIYNRLREAVYIELRPVASSRKAKTNAGETNPGHGNDACRRVVCDCLALVVLSNANQAHRVSRLTCPPHMYKSSTKNCPEKETVQL